ncbi:MAG: DUF309 domain-containing protein [Acidobacteriota bacterium]
MPDHPDPVRGLIPPPAAAPARLAPEAHLPPYRHTPGLSPHPRADPRGHSYGHKEPAPTDLTSPDDWRRCRTYLHAIDLYNNGYWWECHEALEGLWIAAGKFSIQALFFQAIIQAAAANIKWHLQNQSAAKLLTRQSGEKLQKVMGRGAADGRTYMGLDVRDFLDRLEGFHTAGGGTAPGAYPPLIELR